MDHQIRTVKKSDRQFVVSVFNHYVLNSYATYGEQIVGSNLFFKFRKEALVFYILEIRNKPVGFGLLRSYLKHENFRKSAIITYFITPEHTGKGLGKILLNKLIEFAGEKKIISLVAHISSKNLNSLKFHKKNGFKECGSLRKMGVKFNEDIDIVWVQKIIGS